MSGWADEDRLETGPHDGLVVDDDDADHCAGSDRDAGEEPEAAERPAAGVDRSAQQAHTLADAGQPDAVGSVSADAVVVDGDHELVAPRSRPPPQACVADACRMTLVSPSWITR